jgi:hypothetical protein
MTRKYDHFEEDRIYDCQEIADKLGYKRSSIRDKVFKNDIPSLKCGRGKNSARRFCGADLNKWLSEINNFQKSELPVNNNHKHSKKNNGLKDFESIIAKLNKKEK